MKSPAALMRHPLGWIATGCGAGLAPRAPGTVGSAVALLPAWWLLQCSLWVYLVVLAGTSVLGGIAGAWANKQLGAHDSGCIVIDEWAGMWLTLLPLYFWSAPGPLWLWLLLGFTLFRVTDISKPWPASWADRHVHGGLGVMLDDLLAAIWSGGLFALALWLAARG